MIMKFYQSCLLELFAFYRPLSGTSKPANDRILFSVVQQKRTTNAIDFMTEKKG